MTDQPKHEEPGDDEFATGETAAERRAARARREADAHDQAEGHEHEHDKGDDEEDDDDEQEAEGHEEDAVADARHDDPTWWAPHAVLGGLVLLGLLGFFGAFNRLIPGAAAGTTNTSAASLAGGREHAANSAGRPTLSPSAIAALRDARAKGRPGADAAQGETIGAQHLLVAYQGSQRAGANITRTKDAARARAGEALAKIKGGANFDDVVKQYTDEPGAASKQPPGTLGTFRRGAMVAAFDQAAFGLKAGEISSVVETPFGFHVIKRTQLKSAPGRRAPAPRPRASPLRRGPRRAKRPGPWRVDPTGPCV